MLFLYGIIPTFQPVDNFGRARHDCRHRLSPLLPARLLQPLPALPTCPALAGRPCDLHRPFPQVYAVYGGFFILLSYLWGWAVDGVRPDVGDWASLAQAARFGSGPRSPPSDLLLNAAGRLVPPALTCRPAPALLPGGHCGCRRRRLRGLFLAWEVQPLRTDLQIEKPSSQALDFF